MANMKVSILNVRKILPELGGITTPVYSREIPEELLVPIIRRGLVVVDAADLTPIGLDETGERPKKLTPATTSGAPSPGPASSTVSPGPTGSSGGSGPSGSSGSSTGHGG